MRNTLNKFPVIIFDVNETLFDMSAVKLQVNKALNSSGGFQIWFGQLLHYSLVDTVIHRYHDFGAIASATLDMSAKMLETEINAEDKAEILNSMKDLSPYEDVKKGLQQLKNAGFRLYALTNSPESTLKHLLKSARIDVYFNDAFSVDDFQLYKPHPDTYKLALAKIGVRAQDAIMVAAHGWDIAGALNAGMQAAFIERRGQSLYPLAPKPTFAGKNLVEVANRIIDQASSISI